MKTKRKKDVKHGQRINTGNGHRAYVAKADPYYYPGGWDDNAGVYQYCKCGGCGNHLVSWAKNAICPICSKEVYLT